MAYAVSIWLPDVTLRRSTATGYEPVDTPSTVRSDDDAETQHSATVRSTPQLHRIETCSICACASIADTRGTVRSVNGVYSTTDGLGKHQNIMFDH